MEEKTTKIQKQKAGLSASIVAVVPAYHNFPGGFNYTIMIIRSRGGTLIEERIQPAEMTAEMLALFDVCAHAHEAMKRAVERSCFHD